MIAKIPVRFAELFTRQGREKWIAEAAYYRAEKRGFVPGFALEDWVAAEALVDFEMAQVMSPRTGITESKK
jgi:hypothetical protein